MHKTIFISDLHLDENHPEIAEQFLRLLSSCDASVDALYILGDLFEVWIGDDDMTPFHNKIFQALKTATHKGLDIYFMHGNRDFFIGKRFMRETGCKILPDEKKIDLYGLPVLLMHGDTLCTHDVKYLRARKFSRNRIIQFLILLFPLWARRNVANKIRAKSMLHTQSTPKEIMDVTQAEVERVMLKHKVTHLIHGHTHRPNTHNFQIDRKNAIRIVLGAWHGRGSMLVCDEAGKFSVQELD